MKLATLPLLWIATISACTAVPTTEFMGAVMKQQVDVDQCVAETVIGIPMWFCTDISPEDQPLWLTMMCNTVQQSTHSKVQQTTGGERTVPGWICEIVKEEDRLKKISDICSAIVRFRLQKWLGISHELCALGDSLAERVLAECGTLPVPEERPEEGERPKTFARRQRRTVTGGKRVPQHMCDDASSPGYLGFLYITCEERRQQLYDIPDWICDLSQDQRKEVLTTECPRVLQKISSQQRANGASPVICEALHNPHLLNHLQVLCDDETVNPEIHGVPQIACDIQPEKRMEVLRAICAQSTGEKTSKVQQYMHVPPYICESLGRKDFKLMVMTDCKGEPGIPATVCDLPPEQRISQLTIWCSYPLAERQSFDEMPNYVCREVREPYFQSILKTNCKALYGIPDKICDLPPDQRVGAIEEDCGGVMSMNGAIAQSQPKTRIQKWICDSILELGLPKWLNNMCEMNDKLPTPGEICCSSETNTP